MARRRLVWGAAFVALLAVGCAGSKRPPRPPSHTFSTKMDPSSAEKQLALARADKYAEVYRAYATAQTKADSLEAKVLERDREANRLRDEVNTLKAQGGGVAPERETGRLVYRGSKLEGRVEESADVVQLRAALEQAETRLKRLRAETSSGPFDNGPRNALRKAYDEIDELKAQLLKERQERETLARQFEQLRAQAPQAVAKDNGGRPSDSDAMKIQLQHMLESIQRDLAASRQREEDLKLALAEKDSASASAPVAAVSTVATDQLKSENAGLRARLDEEHRRNQELATKLESASRVTGLIFKMQGGANGAAAVPAR